MRTGSLPRRRSGRAQAFLLLASVERDRGTDPDANAAGALVEHFAIRGGDRREQIEPVVLIEHADEAARQTGEACPSSAAFETGSRTLAASRPGVVQERDDLGMLAQRSRGANASQFLARSCFRLPGRCGDADSDFGIHARRSAPPARSRSAPSRVQSESFRLMSAMSYPRSWLTLGSRVVQVGERLVEQPAVVVAPSPAGGAPSSDIRAASSDRLLVDLLAGRRPSRLRFPGRPARARPARPSRPPRVLASLSASASRRASSRIARRPGATRRRVASSPRSAAPRLGASLRSLGRAHERMFVSRFSSPSRCSARRTCRG